MGMRVTEADTFEALVAARAPALLRLAHMLTGSVQDAEDLLQQTLVKGHRHADRLLTMNAPAAYLRRIMVNEHTSGVRMRARRPVTTSLLDHDLPSRDGAEQVDERDAAWRLFATLPRRQRAVLVLRIYEDLTDPQIADLLGCSEGTVRSNASRALKTLRERLGDRDAALDEETTP